MSIDVVTALDMLGLMSFGTAQPVLREAVKEIERLREIEAAAVEIVRAKEQGIELSLEHEACQTVLRLARGG